MGDTPGRLCLFIGGPWDGEVHAVQVRTWDITVTDSDLSSLVSQEESTTPAAFPVHRYTLTRLRFFGQLCQVYVLEGMDEKTRDLAMFQALIPANLREALHV